MSIPWVPIAVLVLIVGVVAVVIYLVYQSKQSQAGRYVKAAAYELDTQPSAPGEYVNLPQAWAQGSTLAHYGSGQPNTNSHVTHDVDYNKETSPSSANGLPPVGGPHWGSTTCGSDPASAPAYCGPVQWGAYRAEWHAENLVHNMEHGGVIVWYNLTNTALRDQIEKEAIKLGKDGYFLVMAPYSKVPANTIWFTSWARRELVPAAQYDNSKLDTFVKYFNCRFNPENFSCR